MELMNLLRAGGYLKLGPVALEAAQKAAPQPRPNQRAQRGDQAGGAETVTVAKTILPAAERAVSAALDDAGTTVVIIHAAIALWLIYLRETNTSVGEPPTEVMIELAPLPVAPSDTPPEITPGPQMKQAEPEEAVEPQQTIAVPALPPAPKPAVVCDDGTKTNRSRSRRKSGEESGEVGTRAASTAYKCSSPQRAAPARTAAVPRQGSSGLRQRRLHPGGVRFTRIWSGTSRAQPAWRQRDRVAVLHD
jgi:hypothetical protein